ncbi:MAG: hypothetical protein ACREHE_08310 [Rhizomicrobium sp.]
MPRGIEEIDERRLMGRIFAPPNINVFLPWKKPDGGDSHWVRRGIVKDCFKNARPREPRVSVKRARGRRA